MQKSILLFGKRIDFNQGLDYGIKNSKQEFGLLNVEKFLSGLNHYDRIIAISFLQERIYELNYMVRLKKLVSYVYGTVDLKKESVIQSYINTIKLFEGILQELKSEYFK